jgi:hypothetical protein
MNPRLLIAIGLLWVGVSATIASLMPNVYATCGFFGLSGFGLGMVEKEKITGRRGDGVGVSGVGGVSSISGISGVSRVSGSGVGGVCEVLWLGVVGGVINASN